MGWKKQQTVLDISLVMATTALLVSAAVAAAGGVVPFAIAQEEQASLGEDNSLADGIVSEVLDDHNNVVVDQQHNTAEQDAANTNVDSDVQLPLEAMTKYKDEVEMTLSAVMKVMTYC